MCNKGGREGYYGLGRKGLFGQVGVGGEKGGEGKGRERGVQCGLGKGHFLYIFSKGRDWFFIAFQAGWVGVCVCLVLRMGFAWYG